jgi:hypothetical protein
MPLFRLTPLLDRLADPAWRNSSHHAVVCVHAVDDRAARTLLSNACQAWVDSVGASRSFRVSPWEDPHLVTCVQVDESGETEVAHDTMVGAAPDNEEG